MRYGSKLKSLIFLNLGLIILDRLTKWFVLKNPNLYQSKFIELELFKNQNLFFFPLNPIFLNLLIGAVLILLLFLFFKTLKQENFLLTTGFSLIILGGLSNFFDRIYFGYVIDWLRIFILPISIFNIADIMIIGGIMCVILFFGQIISGDTQSAKKI